MSTEIIKNIESTIAYFNAFDYPPTTFEIYQHIINIDPDSRALSCLLKEVADGLASKSVKDRFSCEKGFWFIKGKELLAEERIKKQKISVAKIKRLRRWAKVIFFTPFIRGLVITGTLAQKRAVFSSDWDVILIFKKGRIWVGRFLVTALLFALNKKRYGKKIKDRFCLNHFFAEDGLIFEEQNLFSAGEISLGIPIFGSNIWSKLQKLNWLWIRSYKPNYSPENNFNIFKINISVRDEKLKGFAENFFDKVLFSEKLNFWLKKAMVKKIKSNPKTYLPGADIRYSDQALVFLPCPQRDRLIKKTHEILTKKVN